MQNKKTIPPIRPFIRFTIPLLLPLLILSCTSRPVEKQELVIGVSQDYRATDVFSHKGFNCLVFETLIKMDQNGTFGPLLAQSWEKSTDGRHYTFYLRKDVRFSDGTPLTADQVKAAMFYKHNRERKRGPAGGFRKGGADGNAGPETGSPGRRPSARGEESDINRAYGTFDNRRYNLPDWSCFSSIDVLDPHTIRFNLARPYTLFLDELASTHSYPVLKIDDSEAVTGYIGTGPFKIETLERTRYMTLIRNDQYWQGPVEIQRIRLKVIPDPETRAMALEAGEIDLTGYDHFDNIPNEAVVRLKSLPRLTVKTLGNAWQPSVSYIAINARKPPFQDPAVRRALAMAMDTAPIQTLISETGRILDSPFPDGHPLRRPGLDRQPFNRAEARRLLKGAGWTDGDGDGILDKDGRPLELTLTFSFFDPQYKTIAEMVQAQLRDIGVKLTLNMVELGAHITVMRNGAYDLAFWPMMRYHMFFYTGHPSWLNVYSSPELDNAFLQYLHGNDAGLRKAAVQKTQELIGNSFVFPLFFERFDVVAWNHEVLKNFTPLPIGWDLSMGLWQSGWASRP